MSLVLFSLQCNIVAIFPFQIKAIINKALKIVDQMSTAVFNRKSPGEETVLQSKAFAVKLKRDMAYDLSNQTLVLPHSSNGEIDIPTLCRSNMTCAPSEYIRVQVSSVVV